MSDIVPAIENLTRALRERFTPPLSPKFMLGQLVSYNAGTNEVTVLIGNSASPVVVQNIGPVPDASSPVWIVNLGSGRMICVGSQDPAPGGTPELPVGGTTGQALVKASNADYDVAWATVGGGGGPSTFYLMAGMGGIIRTTSGGVITVPVNATFTALRVNLRVAAGANVTFSVTEEGTANVYSATIVSGALTALLSPSVAMAAGLRLVTSVTHPGSAPSGSDLTAMLTFVPT